MLADVMPCSLVPFRRKLLPPSSWREVKTPLSWIWRQLPPKVWYLYTKMHGVTSPQKS